MPTNAVANGFWTAMPGGSRVNNARAGRALLQGIYGNIDATPLNGTRSGVIVTTGLTLMSDLLVQVTSGLNMTVAPGVAIAHRSGQGPYEGWLFASAAITCDAAPATNPRNDLVVMRWYDSAQGDTSPDGNPCRIEIITGAPGAVPVDPVTVNSLGVITNWATAPVPAQAAGGGIGIVLARAQVSTAGVITLTRLRKSVSIPGAVRVLLEGDNDTGGRVGDLRYNSTTDVFEVKRSDGNWYSMKTGPDVYLEVRATANQVIAASSGANKLNFGTTVRSSGMTLTGGNTVTIPSDGRYSLYAAGSTNFAAGNNFGVGINGTSGPGAGTPWLSSPLFSNGQTDSFTAVTRWFTAGTQLCAYVYNNGSAFTMNPTTGNPAEFIIHKVS